MREGLCGDEERDKCEFEYGKGPELEWTCENCPKKPLEDLNPYTMKLLNLRTLKKAGYPLKANDILYEEWLDLGRVCSTLDTGCPFMGSGKSESGGQRTEDGSE